MDRFHIRKVLTFTLLLGVLISHANARPVNILTWWGYLNAPGLMDEIGRACGAEISYDDYYTNQEFLSRLDGDRYDIIIHSDVVYDFTKDIVAQAPRVNLSQISDRYHPAVKQRFIGDGYTENTALFQLSLTGFLWNRNTFSVDESQQIEDIFQAAKGKRIVVIDDAIEVANLVAKAHSPNGLRRIETLVGDSQFVITNSLGKIFSDASFSFAYTWSGAALSKLRNNPHLRFTIHPSLSHISRDLITALSADKAAVCVAKALSSESFLNGLMLTTKYYSPFLSVRPDDIEDKLFAHDYTQFLQHIDALPWLQRYPTEQYNQLEEEWLMIKLQLGHTL
ncbi:hypothetical protein ONV78_13245 [Hahella sp. CR1]|uniref:hypothetical protein n=1 Tax=Hahella sp. CR1 TaxID=2992807 RepID=UPI0024414143|nr:hypothetical protein [Hahella sp. CR1]MDG9668702.1 hypothetical protein [Hahella sp. CR1]